MNAKSTNKCACRIPLALDYELRSLEGSDFTIATHSAVLACGVERARCFGDDFLVGSLAPGALLDGAVIGGFGHDVGQVGDLELDGARWMVAVAQIWIEICCARWVETLAMVCVAGSVNGFGISAAWMWSMILDLSWLGHSIESCCLIWSWSLIGVADHGGFVMGLPWLGNSIDAQIWNRQPMGANEDAWAIESTWVLLL
ncbi:hypothetical protein ACLOJK_018960 [Asimina triloba]